MRKIDQLLTEYGESHQNQTNKLIHWICVPLIFLSIVGLLWSVPSDNLRFVLGTGPFNNWATIALFVTVLYYMRISFPLSIGMAAFSVFCLWSVRLIEMNVALPLWQVSLIIFAQAWIGQFYGHKVEGKKPSFFKDLQFLLVGPAWLMHFIYKKLGLRY